MKFNCFSYLPIQYSTTKDDGPTATGSGTSSDTKTPRFATINTSTYRPSYSLSSGTYKAPSKTTTTSSTSSGTTTSTPYVSRYATLSSNETKEKEREKEKEKEKEKLKEKEKELEKEKNLSVKKPSALAKITSKYGSAKDLTASPSDTKSRYSSTASLYSTGATKPKKDDGPPVTYNTRQFGKPTPTTRDPSPAEPKRSTSSSNYSRLSSTGPREKSRDPSPADTKRTMTALERITAQRARSRDPSPIDGKRTASMIYNNRALSRDPSPATTTKRMPLTYNRTLSNQSRSRDPSPAEANRTPLSYSRSLNNREKSIDSSSSDLRRPSISVTKAKSRDPSPIAIGRLANEICNSINKLRSRDTSPVGKTNGTGGRRVSRDTSPAEASKDRFGSTTSGFSSYRLYGKGGSTPSYNSNSKYGTTTSSASPSKPTDLSISYMTTSESRGRSLTRPSAVNGSRLSVGRKTPITDSEEKEILKEKSPVVEIKSLPLVNGNKSEDSMKDKSSSDETETETETETSDESEESSESEKIVEPKIMIEVCVVTRATSPTPPGSTPFLRARRAEMAKTIEKTIQRQLNRGLCLDKETQSDRMDDSTKYSRYCSSSSRAASVPWSTYLDPKYSPSPTGSYSRYGSSSSRYSREPSTTSTRSEREKPEEKSSASNSNSSVSPQVTSSSEKKEDKLSLAARVREQSAKLSASKSNSGRSISTKSASSSTSSIAKVEKQKSPPKQKSNEPSSTSSSKSRDLPPQAPKAESPTKSISSSSSGCFKWTNKDFRKSALNMGPAERPRKSSSKTTMSPDLDSNNSMSNNVSHSPSPSRRSERSPSMSHEPSPSRSRSERSPSVASELSSNSSESTIDTASQLIAKTKASSRTSLLASSVDDLPYDKISNKFNKSSIATDSLNKNKNNKSNNSTNESKSVSSINSLGGPLNNLFKNKSDSIEKNWLDTNSVTSISESLNQDTEPWKMESDTQSEIDEQTLWIDSKSDDLDKSVMSGVSSAVVENGGSDSVGVKGNNFPHNLRHIDSGDQSWWLNSNDESGVVSRELSVDSDTKFETNSDALSNGYGTDKNMVNKFNKLRHIESGEKAWWLKDKEKSTEPLSERSSSKSLNKVNEEQSKDSSSEKSNSKIAGKPLFQIRPIESGERAWWLASESSNSKKLSKNQSKSSLAQTKKESSADTENDVEDEIENIETCIIRGLQQFPVSTSPEPLGDRASPEGLEDSSGRKSPYDNIDNSGNLKHLLKDSKLFISRHRNIDDLLGGSCHPLSPVMNRMFVIEDLQDNVTTMNTIFNSPQQQSIMQNNSSRLVSLLNV